MGKSALRLILKLAKVHPVVPRPDAKGVQQPLYLKGATAIQTSPKLRRYHEFMRRELAGKKFGSRLEARRAFAEAARKWKAEQAGTTNDVHDEHHRGPRDERGQNRGDGHVAD